ncbi:hypothetical protein JI664_12805 [Rhodobacter sp. NTK016B]|uniref:S24 family peptidase n=1 Tax=Rhodobacter sp. NTK016B TaxID=2759676 RepID=UPI001A8C910F|nr:S24 family peptidase [Rhodobacter sp. NTK016B]MBN8292847.1 hypothetical protein [Rhodobacter sp. NTK016B]
MEAIDGKWIVRHLTGRRGEKAQLARAIGTKPDNISKIISGVRAVQPEEVPKVLEFFGYEVRPSAQGEEPPRSTTAQPVKLISWVSAGQLVDHPAIDSFEDFPSIYAADLPPGRWIALRVDGTSMNKLSPPESIVIVNLDDTRLVPGRCYVVADETGAATYKAYDPNAEPQFQPRSYIENTPAPVFVGAVRVVGRVYRTMLDM